MGARAEGTGSDAPRLARVLALGAGRRMGYALFGPESGAPVIYCHGFPGSRMEARLAEAAAIKLGVRLIAPDRPGYGLSDFEEQRTIGGWAQDVRELADRLELPRFRMLGVSGGAPYALACAARLPERVSSVALVCGLGRLATPAAARMGAFARGAFATVRHAPRVSGWMMQALASALRLRPQWLFGLTSGRLPPADLATLADANVCDVLSASLREALRNGGRGAAHDLALYAREWDFTLRDVAAPCHLWHGDEDTTVPVEMGRETALALRNCRAVFPRGEGHFSLIVRRMEEILATLTRSG